MTAHLTYEEHQARRMRELRARAGWKEGSFGRVWWIDSARPNIGRYATLADSAEQAIEGYQKGFATDEVPPAEPGDWDAVTQIANTGYHVIDPYEWEPWIDYERMERNRKMGLDATPGHYTYVRVRRCKTLSEVSDELRAYLGEEHHNSVDSELTPFAGSTLSTWPKLEHVHRIVVFSVNGSNEGDYVHVEAQLVNGKTELLLLSKTFGGRDESWRLARRVADLLGV